VLQTEVNKYVGCLHAALREFHSGWSMTDYATKATCDFAIKQGKMFKHDIVYDILRRSLPKYEISINTIHPKVAWALALLDNDREPTLELNAVCVAAKFPVANITALLNSDNNNVDNNVEAEPVLSDDASATDSGRHRALLDLAITVTPRPSIRKKKAKAIAQAASANKKMKVQLPLPRSASISNTSNNVALDRLASAAETKNKVNVWLWLLKPKTELLKSS
jgi:hypothetical protein